MRQLAWFLHAVVDGMVVGSVPSFALLLPAGFAVLICSLQDGLAYAVFLTRRRSTPSLIKAALTAFALAFPLGAGISSLLQNSLHDTAREGFMILRVVIAAVFCYMATELAPAHTHSKCANLIHACLFAIGIGAAGLAELFEGVVSSES